MRTPSDKARRARRGFSLLIVLIVVTLLAGLAAAFVSRASSANDADAAKRRYDRTVSCADAAREMLTSKFDAYGTSPTQLTLNSVLNDQKMTTGHYDSVAVTSVSAAAGTGGGNFGVSDVSPWVSLKSASCTTALTVPPAPEDFWQLRQWQARSAVTGAEMV